MVRDVAWAVQWCRLAVDYTIFVGSSRLRLDRDCRPDGLDKEPMKMDYMLLEAAAEDPDSEDKDCWKLVGKDPGRRFKKGLYW